MMSEEQFRKQLRESGYGEGEFKDFKANLDGPLHTHDFSAMLLVVSGEFILGHESGATAFGPGESCEVPAGTRHAERTGAGGARVLLGRK